MSKKDENQLQIEGMEINEPEVKKEVIDENEKVKNIVKKAKESGKMTYGELAKELGKELSNIIVALAKIK